MMDEVIGEVMGVGIITSGEVATGDDMKTNKQNM